MATPIQTKKAKQPEMTVKDVKETILSTIFSLHRDLREKMPFLDTNTFAACLQQAAQEYLMTAAPTPKPSPTAETRTKLIRVYVDGCFDIMHSGHYNVLRWVTALFRANRRRQAKQLGDVVVAGVHSDAEILKNKRPPVMNEEERVATVRSCKWVDEVEFDTPYSPDVALLDRLNCDFGVHGDDLPIGADGKSAYDELMRSGRLRIVKRTEGVSTTDLVGRLLLMSKEHLRGTKDSDLMMDSDEFGTTSRRLSLENPLDGADPMGSKLLLASAPSAPRRTMKRTSSFLPTSFRVAQFSNARVPSSEDVVVYIDGAFDLFHIGHIETLEKARAMGSFLLVGIHSDQVVNEHRGRNYPIMNLHERVMNVLSCKFVDDVVIGAPWMITEDMVNTFNIKIIASGANTKLENPTSPVDPYAVAKGLGIYRTVECSRPLTTEQVSQRIVDNHDKYAKINVSREEKEASYYAQDKAFIGEL